MAFRSLQPRRFVFAAVSHSPAFPNWVLGKGALGAKYIREFGGWVTLRPNYDGFCGVEAESRRSVTFPSAPWLIAAHYIAPLFVR